MEFSLDDNRAGAGSSILLSAEIVAIRAKLIEACDEISSAMGNITYAGQANGGEPGTRDCHTMFPANSNFTTTVQRVRLAPSNSADGNHDASVICITINGDLA